MGRINAIWLKCLPDFGLVWIPLSCFCVLCHSCSLFPSDYLKCCNPITPIIKVKYFLQRLFSMLGWEGSSFESVYLNIFWFRRHSIYYVLVFFFFWNASRFQVLNESFLPQLPISIALIQERLYLYAIIGIGERNFRNKVTDAGSIKCCFALQLLHSLL